MESIPRSLLVVLLALQPATTAVGTPARWSATPEYLDLFVAPNHRQSYDIAVTSRSLDEAIAEVVADQNAAQTPGAWQPRGESPRDAFGTAGAYNSWLLARLYGGMAPRVARGARLDRGRVVEAWTLISPYPSADLRTLHPGTMRLILTVSP